MRILFITATRLGDAVLSTGLLAELVQSFPQARVTVACGAVPAGLFARAPHVHEVLVIRKRPMDLHWAVLWGKVAWSVWDVVVDLRGSALSLLLVARRRIVMRGGRRAGHRLTHIAGAAGLGHGLRPVAWTAPADRTRAEALLPAGGPVLGLGPTANWSGKVWPAERFAALAGALSAHLPGVRVAVFGGPGSAERAAALPVFEGLPDAVDLVGRLSLPEVAACLARCALFIGNDSGLMHLAAAAGAATLGLFGPSLASEYAPVGRCTAFVTAAGPPGTASMMDLGVGDVVRAALALLRRDGVGGLEPASAAP